MSIKEQIVWSGMLLKSPPKCKNVDDSTSFTKWESRFFEFVFLRDENTHVLRYFIDESKSKFKKEIALGKDSEAKLFTNIESKSHKNVFCIASPKRRFFMSAQSAYTAKKWFTELATACPHLSQTKSAEMDTTAEREELKQLEEQLESQEIEEYKPDADETESAIIEQSPYDTLEDLIDPNLKEPDMYVDMRSTTPSMSKRMSNISSSVSSSDTTNELMYGNWEMHRQNESDKAVVAEDSSKGPEVKKEQPQEEATPSIPSRSLKNKPEPEPTELHYIDLSNTDNSENVDPTPSQSVPDTDNDTEYADIDPARTQALESAKKMTMDSPSTGRRTRHSHSLDTNDSSAPPLLPLKLNELPKSTSNDVESAEDYVDQLLSILPDVGDPTYANTVCLDTAPMTSKQQSNTPSTTTRFVAPTLAQGTTRQQPYVNIICLPKT
eukprot:m.212257 g.212257  ORF g.212257 m.212257 type:complete len:438 (-) comp33120_c12_seq2:481-1794(-)